MFQNHLQGEPEIRKSEELLSVISPVAGDKYLAETVKLRFVKDPVFTEPKLMADGLMAMLATCEVACEMRPTVEVR